MCVGRRREGTRGPRYQASPGWKGIFKTKHEDSPHPPEKTAGETAEKKALRGRKPKFSTHVHTFTYILARSRFRYRVHYLEMARWMVDIYSYASAVIRQKSVNKIRTEPPPRVVRKYGSVQQICQCENLYLCTPGGDPVHLCMRNVSPKQ